MSVAEDDVERSDPGLADALPGLARIAGTAAVRTAGWSINTYLSVSGRLFRAAVSPQAAAELIEDVGDEVRHTARRLLGVGDIEERLRAVVPQQAFDRFAGEEAHVPTQAEDLRDRGTELLRRSADVLDVEEAHPAYARILGELAPDEARILRFIALSGPQPAVDVRSSKTLNVTSQLVAPGISMIAAGAGVRYVDRVPAYLNNLFRLGLIWFSREPLEDPLRYQVLEAQPDVLAALKGPGRGRTVRRSINLTPFGLDFCRACLPVAATELAPVAAGLEGPDAVDPGAMPAAGEIPFGGA